MKDNQSLRDNAHWQQLLLSADNSIDRNHSFYEHPEPDLFNALLADFNGEAEKLIDEVFDLISYESNPGNLNDNSWAALKEGATLIHHLQIKNKYKPSDNWEKVAKVLWRALGDFAKGKWSDYSSEGSNHLFPIDWKKQKFVVDTFLETIYHLPRGDYDRIERFFSCKMSEYWKSFQIFWDRVWGAFHGNQEEYYGNGGFRNNHKLLTYHFLAYRLKNFDSEFNMHPDKSLEAFRHFEDYKKLIPSETKARKEIYYELFKYLRESGEQYCQENDFASIRNILGDADVFKFLAKHKELKAADRGRLWLSFEDLKKRWKVSQKYEFKILPDILAALSHHEAGVRESARSFLKPYDKEVFKYLRYIENKEETEGEDDSIGVFKKIERIYQEETVARLIKKHAFTQEQKGKFLLATPNLLEARWEAADSPNHQDLLPIILSTVNAEDAVLGSSAAGFLQRKSAVLQKRFNELIDDLNQEDQANELIASAIEFGSDTALKAILNKCIVWVASESKGTLVDRAAQKARYVSGSVLALINLLNNYNDLRQDDLVKKYVRDKVLEDQQNPTVSRVFEDEETVSGEHDSHTISEMYKWCYSLKERAKSYTDMMASQEGSFRKLDGQLVPVAVIDLAKSMLTLLMEEKFMERELAVQKWITHLLGEMSDRWFFEDKIDVYNQIKNQLERLAIEPLSKRLPKEENLDIRENLVKILGNIGGRVAVDALVRTVTGEERERAARQELLSEYYLKPSKARSEEAAILLTDAVDNAKKTMRLLQMLNVATFIMGAVLIMGGIAISLVSEELGGRVTGVLAGLGGLAAILTQFLKDPLERIQRAMADLVQVQTAFTSFVWELNLNGTYIQSQYVSEGVLTDFDLRQTIGRIDHAMERTMHLIQVYADGNATLASPQLHYIVPAKDGSSDSLAVFGQALSGRKSSNGNTDIKVALNHKVIDAVIEMSSNQMVLVTIDAAQLAPFAEVSRLWLSLIIDGRETNGLPFSHKKTSTGPGSKEEKIKEDIAESKVANGQFKKIEQAAG